ncbi:MAG: TonB-dependent receptor [Woeseiaceae bacterium]
MPRISKSKLLSAASAFTIGVFAASASQAQEAEAAADEELIEEIVATGIRGSLANSIADKRSADQIVDTINAEDIGKSTDQNIAEALNRISGVSITEQEGEGAFVSIRGASPDQTVVTLNGSTLGTTEFSQSVNLSSFSSDILAKIEVIKTPSADDEEGSLGGLVNLITRKPLDINEDIRVFTMQGRWNQQYNQGKEFDSPLPEDYKISATVSDKFFDDTFGVIVSVADERNPLRQDFTSGNNFDQARSYNAQDLDGNVYQAADYVTPSLWGIAARSTAYGVREGQRDRQSLDLAAQWDVADTTNITANLNFGRQQVENTTHQATIRNNDQSRDPNFNNVGLPYNVQGNAFLDLTPTPFQDPSEWMILDANSRTWVRTLRRFQPSDINAASDKYENENFMGSLDLEQELFGKLIMNVGGSYQKSEQIPDQRVFTNLQSARENPVYNRFFLSPDELQPAGVDCRTGVCVPITGDSPVNLGSVITAPTAQEIADLAAAGIVGTVGQPIQFRGDDNFSLTGANPDDILAKSIGTINQTLTTVEDTNEVFFVDFDYDLDKFGVSFLEFGAKYTKREKFVDNQSGNVTNLNAAATIINPTTGLPILVSNALDQIPILPFAQNIAPNDFMNGIGLGGNAISDGFVSVDPVGLFELVRGEEGIAIDIDNTETRSAKFDNLAVYLKANFELMDQRLTGDVGLRYVKTEVETKGAAGIRAFNEAFGRNQRIYDLRNLRSLMDPSQPACPAIPVGPGGEVTFGDAARYARVDGLGVDTLGTATFNDDVPLPNSLPCHEPWLLDATGIQANNGFIVDLRRYNNIFWTNNDIFTNGFATSDPAGLNLVSGTNNTIRTFGTAGAHEYDVLLPSLNLSYLLNDEMIVRFAASKTMTRPPIDDIRPGFNIGETGWGNPATRTNNINLFNTQLDPLKSTNFDVSFEWYFDEDALVSVGVFHKDIKDLIETEQQQVYLRDVKTEVQNGEDVSFDGLLLSDSTITIDNCYAEILGEWQYGYNPSYVENMLFSDDPEFLCAQFQATQPRNAAGADITGVELQYAQNYTFLPGMWGGLGLAANYTYQDSSFAQDLSDLVAGLELPRFQIDRTPEHSYNITAYWQHDDGHQVRLAYSGASDVLLQRNFERGALWQDGRDTLDFAAAYQYSDNISFTFDATNLLDETYRTYFTSRTVLLPESATGGGTSLVPFDEGNPISGNAYQGRTVNEYSIGKFYRAAVRINF